MPNLVIERGCQEFYRQMWTQQEVLARGAAGIAVPSLTLLERGQIEGRSAVLVSPAVLGEAGRSRIVRAARDGIGPLYESTRVSIDLSGKPKATYPAVPIRTKLFAAPQSGAFGWAVFTDKELRAMRVGLGLEKAGARRAASVEEVAEDTDGDDDLVVTPARDDRGLMLMLNPSDLQGPALFSPYEMMLPTSWVRDFLTLFSDDDWDKDDVWGSLKTRRFIPWSVYGFEPNAGAFFIAPWLEQYFYHSFTTEGLGPRLNTALAANQGRCVLEVFHDDSATGLKIHIPVSEIEINTNMIKALCVDVFTLGAGGLHWEGIKVEKGKGKRGAAKGTSETLPNISELPTEFEAFKAFLQARGGTFKGIGKTDDKRRLQVGPYRLGAQPYQQFHFSPNRDYRIELEIQGSKLVIKYALLNEDGKGRYGRRSSIELSEVPAAT